MHWIWVYPLWTILVNALLAAGITYLLYRGERTQFEASKYWIYFLAFLRWCTLFLIGLLLINPLLKKISSEKISPTILILQDQSTSIRAGLNPAGVKKLESDLANLRQDLSKDFKVKEYGFGTEILDSIPQTKLFTQLGTDIQKSIRQAEDMHVGQHIGAVILCSDGIYNQGSNPIYSQAFAGIPLFTIAVGDSSRKTNAGILRARYNDLVYLGDEVQILVDLNADHLAGQLAHVQLKDNQGHILSQTTQPFKEDEAFETVEFRVKTNAIGIQKYQIEINRFANEKTYRDNNLTFYIQVVDGRQKILLLYDAPHPDIKMVREVLNQMKNLEVTVSQIDQYEGNVAQVDLLILDGLPSIRNVSATNKIQPLLQKSGSIWWIATTQTDWTALNQMQHLIQITSTRTPNDVFPVFQANYQKFFVSDQAIQWLNQVPPLVAPYGNYKLSPNAEVVWSQKLGSVKTALPLLITGEQSSKRAALLLGEGLWRWSLSEYQKDQVSSKSSEWVERLVQYIANKTDHRPFRIKTGKTIYNESEPISVEAALYSASAQMVNPSDIHVELKSDKGYHSNFLMDKTQNAYTYNLGKLPAGSYTLKGKTIFENKDLSAEYKFVVQPFDIETSRTRADFGLLNTLALNHQGRMFRFNQIDEIAEYIRNDSRIKPIYKEQSTTKALIDYRILLFMILTLLSIEWFLRRYFGKY